MSIGRTITRFIPRRDHYKKWIDVNPILQGGEISLDLTNSKMKIGDGVTSWKDLEYIETFEQFVAALCRNGIGI